MKGQLPAVFLFAYFLFPSSVWAIGKTPLRLPEDRVRRESITVSGSSSGGTMAQQVYFSYSSLLSGVAVFSHAYYRCGAVSDNLQNFRDFCSSMENPRINDLYDVNLALLDIQNYTQLGLIDDPRRYMANKPFYVFAGTSNYLITTDVSLQIVNVFEPFVKNLDKIHTRIQNANYTLPTDRPGLPGCSDPVNELFISNCGFSGALDSLQFMLGKDVIRAPKRNIKLQPLLEFDQSEFFFGVFEGFGNTAIDMDTIGYHYIPTVCQDAGADCLLHFYFHGCDTGREFVGSEHIIQSGYLEVAEANGIVMVFPQALQSEVNTHGCWDTYGITGNLYATQRGAQVTVVKNMLDRLLSEYNFPSQVHQNTELSEVVQQCTVLPVSKNTILQTCS